MYLFIYLIIALLTLHSDLHTAVALKHRNKNSAEMEMDLYAITALKLFPRRREKKVCVSVRKLHIWHVVNYHTLQASNSASYIQDAFQLLMPILEISHIQRRATEQWHRCSSSLIFSSGQNSISHLSGWEACFCQTVLTLRHSQCNREASSREWMKDSVEKVWLCHCL